LKETPMTATARAIPEGGAAGTQRGRASRPRRVPVAAARRRGRECTEPVILALVVMALMAVGLLMVYSASRSVQVNEDEYFLVKHLMFLPIALGAMAGGAYLPHRWLNRRGMALAVLGLAVGLLAAVLVVGLERNGARRWLGFMGFSFQPSEYAKFALVIFLAWFFGRPQAEPRSLWRGFLPALLVIGAVSGLIVKEDFGTGALVGLVAVLLCLIAGWRWWFPLLMIVPGVLGFLEFVWMVDFRRRRLEVWLDPWQYFDGKGWHVCQSLLGIGSGGLWGVGLGAGIQKLYIPENTTDFIFAVICEEMGLLGALLVLGLFGVFVWRAGRIVRDAPDRFSFLLATGILLVIGLQAVMNIGVVTSALPAKGISLPFISYGGSGLVMMSFAVGLLMSVARRRGQMQDAPQPQETRPLAYVPAAWVSPVRPMRHQMPDTGGVPRPACPAVLSDQEQSALLPEEQSGHA
jgi:cell division protein FtsW